MNNVNEFTSAGIYLVKPWLIGPIKDENGLIAIKNDAVGVTIGFTKIKEDFILEHDFWMPSEDFTKLSMALDIEKGKKIGEQIFDKQLWVCIREVHDDDGIRYEPFDWIKCTDPNVRPIISGDPIQHPLGKPLGAFIWIDPKAKTISQVDKYKPLEEELSLLQYKEEQRLIKEFESKAAEPFCETLKDFNPEKRIEKVWDSIYEKAKNAVPNPETGALETPLKDASVEERLAAGKAIIENAKKNKSVETSEDDPWADM